MAEIGGPTAAAAAAGEGGAPAQPQAQAQDDDAALKQQLGDFVKRALGGGVGPVVTKLNDLMLFTPAAVSKAEVAEIGRAHV